MTLAHLRSRLLLGAVTLAAAGLAAAPAQATLTISNSATKNVTCSAGICSATAKNAVLNAGDLVAMLASSDVGVRSKSKAQDIELRVALSWASTSRLTLDAYRSITFDKALTVAGSGALTLTTNDGGTGGELSFVSPGRAIFWDLSSSLVIDGASYTLVGDIATLASDIAADPSGHYALANNFDASVDGTYASSPIPTTFNGTFEGLGNAISNLTINDMIENDNVGFLSALGSNGTIASVQLVKVKVLGVQRSNIGGLVGDSAGLVIDSLATGSVAMAKGSTAAGGDVGGLVGFSEEGSISCSRADVAVNGRNAAGAVGGLAGAVIGGSVYCSQSTGAVSASDASVGGLIGILDATLSQSFASGSAVNEHQTQLNTSAGGLIGTNFGSVANCYALGNSSTGKSSFVGGLIGFNGGTVMSSYSAGMPSGPSSTAIGGFLGKNTGEATAGYWDTTTSGTNVGVGTGNSSGVVGLTTQELQSGLPSGFDPAIWAQSANVNDGLPYLISTRPQ